MIRIVVPAFLAFILVTLPRKVSSQAALLAADEVVNQACKEAGAQNKKAFILFHASWCGWCHKMDSAMNDSRVKNLFEDHYVVRHIVVYENKRKAILENPGGRLLLAKYDGNDQGIPYWMVFDKNGVLLADSRFRSENGSAPENNVGCPATDRDVRYFIRVLKATSRLKSSQLALIERRFLQIGQQR